MLINITGNTSHSGLKKSDLSSREVLELHDTTTVTAWSTGFAIDVDKKRERSYLPFAHLHFQCRCEAISSHLPGRVVTHPT